MATIGTADTPDVRRQLLYMPYPGPLEACIYLVLWCLSAESLALPSSTARQLFPSQAVSTPIAARFDHRRSSPDVCFGSADDSPRSVRRTSSWSIPSADAAADALDLQDMVMHAVSEIKWDTVVVPGYLLAAKHSRATLPSAVPDESRSRVVNGDASVVDGEDVLMSKQRTLRELLSASFQRPEDSPLTPSSQRSRSQPTAPSPRTPRSRHFGDRPRGEAQPATMMEVQMHEAQAKRLSFGFAVSAMWSYFSSSMQRELAHAQADNKGGAAAQPEVYGQSPFDPASTEHSRTGP